MAQPSFPFMRLPTELRYIIYEQAFRSEPELSMDEFYDQLEPSRTPQGIKREMEASLEQPALTRVCRAMREESLPQFYRHKAIETRFTHTFRHNRPPVDGTLEWLAAIGPRNRASLRSLLVEVDVDSQSGEMAAASKLENVGIREDITKFEWVESIHIEPRPGLLIGEEPEGEKTGWVSMQFAAEEATEIAVAKRSNVLDSICCLGRWLGF